VLQRAARAILPHFALMEQWQSAYIATSATRSQFQSRYTKLVESLCSSEAVHELSLLLPTTMDALVLIYSDMVDADPGGGRRAFERSFERRWRDVERRARVEDPAIVSILPVVRPRIHAGCVLVERFLSSGYDPAALPDYVSHVVSGFSRTCRSADTTSAAARRR
jgi:hypothetical protein